MLRRTHTSAVRKIALAIAVISVFISQTAHADPAPFEHYDERALGASSRVRIEYFFINGDTSAAIRADMAARGPTDFSGIRRDAFTWWTIHWDWPSNSNGTPQFSKIVCDYRVRVILPRWKPLGNPSNELRVRWDRYTNAVERHEGHHLTLVKEHFREPCDDIAKAAAARPDLSSAEANKIGEAALARLRAVQENYDRITENGAIEGVRLP